MTEDAIAGRNNSLKLIVSVIVLALGLGALVFALQKSRKLPGIEAAFFYADRNDQARLDDLLRRKPELASQPTRHGFTLLHDAANRADVSIARLVIGRGADVNALDRQGKTPLDRAEEELVRAKTWKYNPGEAVKMVALLKASGAKPSTGSPAP